MANLSFASGTVTISGPTMQDVQTLLIMQKTYEEKKSHTYDTTLYEFRKEAPHRIRASFTGVGRWSFDHNIDRFFQFVTDSSVFVEGQEEIRHRPFTVTFDGVDEESTGEFKRAFHVTIEWKNGQQHIIQEHYEEVE